jgi:GT2 family glycosyltransferase
MSEISVIVITRNRRTLLCQALERIRALLPHAEIIVVDNASTDDTAEYVHRHFPSVKFIPLAQNVGIPKARNIGARYAQANLLLFLDDDGSLHCPSLPKLIEIFQSTPHWAVLSFPLTASRDGPKLEALSSKLELLNLELGTSSLQLFSWYTFNGGAALIKKEIFWEVGGFPEHFFYSHEEDDLSLRLFARGYRVVVYPRAQFVHAEAGHGSHRLFYYYRNRQWVIWRHLPLGWAVVESLATLLGGLVRTAFTPSMTAFVAGSLAALVRLPVVLRRERCPLSYAQYGQYRALSAGGAGLFSRVKRLWRDMRSGRRLNRIS